MTFSKRIFSYPERPIAFEGVGAVVDPKNLFAFPILLGETSTYSENDNENISKTSGEFLSLVSAYQTRAN